MAFRIREDMQYKKKKTAVKESTCLEMFPSRLDMDLYRTWVANVGSTLCLCKPLFSETFPLAIPDSSLALHEKEHPPDIIISGPYLFERSE